MSKTIEVELCSDGLALVWLQRTPVNALTPVFMAEIGDAMEHTAADSRVKAIVLSGRGRTLSAGLDLKDAAGLDADGQLAVYDGLNGCFARLYELAKPLVVAVNGAAIAGGMFFVLCADHRVVSAQALLGLSEVRVGVTFPEVPREIAVSELGPTGARRLMLTGQTISAHDALALGIADEVVDGDAVMERARERALEFAAIPPETYAAVKQQVRQDTIARYRQALETAPKRDVWFNAETKSAAAAVMAAARTKPS